MYIDKYCEKCEKETSHYYFMMIPVGYWVCDICGTQVSADNSEFEMPMEKTCPVHGKVTYLAVTLGKFKDKQYCEQCYIENVIVANCKEVK